MLSACDVSLQECLPQACNIFSNILYKFTGWRHSQYGIDYINTNYTVSINYTASINKKKTAKFLIHYLNGSEIPFSLRSITQVSPMGPTSLSYRLYRTALQVCHPNPTGLSYRSVLHVCPTGLSCIPFQTTDLTLCNHRLESSKA